jgi:hypothetical protein
MLMLAFGCNSNPSQVSNNGNRGPRTYSELTRLSVTDRATYFANHPSRPSFEPRRLLDNLYVIIPYL